MKYKVSN